MKIIYLVKPSHLWARQPLLPVVTKLPWWKFSFFSVHDGHCQHIAQTHNGATSLSMGQIVRISVNKTYDSQTKPQNNSTWKPCVYCMGYSAYSPTWSICYKAEKTVRWTICTIQHTIYPNLPWIIKILLLLSWQQIQPCDVSENIIRTLRRSGTCIAAWHEFLICPIAKSNLMIAMWMAESTHILLFLLHESTEASLELCKKSPYLLIRNKRIAASEIAYFVSGWARVGANQIFLDTYVQKQQQCKHNYNESCYQGRYFLISAAMTPVKYAFGSEES